MKIAVQGCAHGELEAIYNTIEYIEKQNNICIDLLLCCGDFQATRNLEDLKCMAAPPKFRSLCTFYKYYSGEKIAPKLTIFVGGNHEASNYLQELPYGGWVAPNIYYLGYAGVVNFAGVRIAGLSGIFKGWDFARGRFEKPPYNEETVRSCYHIRNLDIFRLKQLSLPVQIMMSHDWPAGIANHGDMECLLKHKPYFKKDIEKNALGNKPTAELLECMKPDYWFAAHLHVKFAALVRHNDEAQSKVTKFLSLDKCLPKRKFLQILDVPHDAASKMELQYDIEWLTILRLTNHLLSVKKLNNYMPAPNSSERWEFKPTKEDMDLTLNKMENNLSIPKNFVPTAPAHNSSTLESCGKININSQTVELCEKLSIDDPIFLLQNEDGFNNTNSSLNMSDFECSSFVGLTDSEIETSMQANSSESLLKSKNVVRTPLKLPTPSVQLSENLKNDFLTSTPVNKSGGNATVERDASWTVDSKTDTENTTFEEGNKTDDSAGPWPKKFRRRNIAMYSSNDDD